ncbi:hypothetical protein EET67_21430 [Pseudaminobacter arsenicus]|uniref:Uncharacterized protein n=1 Tax=Borborobacter arsenicus TaxID=1851146 RepID=A0A432V0Z4_9HYPH|nr:hypothetical protein [Pseudaminobacter arsenicus]RUM95768.1 hypothetical protein EET67_21430 [Pseudaminobacter arsenicus]
MTSSAELRVITASGDGSEAVICAETTAFEAVSAAEIRKEVQRILCSAQFNASERNRRFLEYVVEEKLAGRSERIKAYTIATVVFGRGVHFDPQQDPVVRMEARRLRRSLERFYLTEGEHGPVRITVPKGGYVPEFHDSMALAEAGVENSSAAPHSSDYVASVLVKQFEVEGDQSIFLSYGHGLTRQLMIGLCRYPHLCVFGSRSHSPSGLALDESTLLAGPNVDYILTGSKAVAAGRLHVDAVLLEARTGRVLWGQNFERELQPKGILNVRDDLANLIVRTLAQPFGVIFDHRARQAVGRERPALTTFDCMVLFHQYRRSYRRKLYWSARESLERAVASDSDCAEAFACLSHLYTDGHRFGLASEEPSDGLRQRATALAHKAIEIAPDSSCGYHALGLAYWFQQDVEASLRATQTALALNTNAAEVAADLGLHWSLLGVWERALPLLDNVSLMNPVHGATHCAGLCLDHFVAERFEQALASAREIPLPVAYGHALRAISLVRLDRREEAADAVRCILDIDSQYGEDVLPDLGGGNLHPDLADRVAEALGDAGLARERHSYALGSATAPKLR